MKFTPNLNLKKPDKTDPISIKNLNDNMDILDGIYDSRYTIKDSVTNKVYKYRLGITNGELVFIYEEVL